MEFKDLTEDVLQVLKEKLNEKEEVAKAVTEGAQKLLNCPTAIQRQPSQFTTLIKTFKHPYFIGCS